jgi:hypothetical protein
VQVDVPPGEERPAVHSVHCALAFAQPRSPAGLLDAHGGSMWNTMEQGHR